MPMNSVLEKPPKPAAAARVTRQSPHREVLTLRQRVADLKDLCELNQAIGRNGAKPLAPWSKAEKESGLA